MRFPADASQLRRMLLVTTRASLSNVVNCISPKLHSKLRRATGRGRTSETPEDIAQYHRSVFARYFEQLAVPPSEIPAFLRGRTILEHGPGDFPGTCMLMIAHGAERAICADRFPLLRQSETNRAAARALGEGLDDEARERLASCFAEDGSLIPSRIRYVVHDDGLARLSAEADLAISCAVLEHVNRLDLTLADIAAALRPGGRACHVVDLSGHGFEWGHPLDFLGVPDVAWRLMSSHNGSLTNRMRLSDHRRIADSLPLEDIELRPTVTIERDVAEQAIPWLAPRFRGRDLSDLTTLGHVLVARRR